MQLGNEAFTARVRLDVGHVAAGAGPKFALDAAIAHHDEGFQEVETEEDWEQVGRAAQERAGVRAAGLATAVSPIPVVVGVVAVVGVVIVVVVVVVERSRERPRD